jgi:hypothetical protein
MLPAPNLPQYDAIIALQATEALRNVDERVMLYYAQLLTEELGPEGETKDIRTRLESLVTLSFGTPFATVLNQLVAKNLLDPRTGQVKRRNNAFGIVQRIFEVGSEGLNNIDFGSLSARPVYGFGKFPPEMNGVLCAETMDDKVRYGRLVDYAKEFLLLFKNGGITVEHLTSYERHRGDLFALYSDASSPMMIVYIVNSVKVAKISELTELVGKTAWWRANRTNEVDNDPTLAGDGVAERQRRAFARTVVGLAISTSWSAKVAHDAKTGQVCISLTGPSNLPVLYNYLKSNVIIDDRNRSMRVRHAFNTFAFYLHEQNNFHSGGVFVADDLIEKFWEPLLPLRT